VAVMGYDLGFRVFLIDIIQAVNLFLQVMVSYSSRELLLKLIDPELRHPPLWEVKKILELGVM
jgi:hypothetical protein